MASVQSLMTKCDPRMEKENMVPRVQRSEPGSAGYSTGRARGLTSSEHRSSAVLKESLLQNVVGFCWKCLIVKLSWDPLS